MISRILLITLEWLAISGATIAGGVAVQDGPRWAMPAACLCAIIGAQLRTFSSRRALDRHREATRHLLRDGVASHRRIMGDRS